MELIIMRTSLCALEIPKGLSKVEVAGGGGSEFFVLWSDCLMKSSTSYRNVHPDEK